MMKKFFQLLLWSVVVAFLALSGTGCSKKAKAARASERADKYYAEGDFDQAEKEYINVLRNDRSSAKAYEQLGTIALEQGRLSRAHFFLARATAMDSNNLDIHVKLGTFFLGAGEKKQAAKEAIFVLDRRPEDPDAPMLLADSAVTLNDYDAVRRRLQKLTVSPAKRAPVEVALGNLYFREQDLKSAQACVERARAADPKFGWLYILLGNIYWTQKDIKHADEAYKFAADNSPTRSPRRIDYAQFKFKNGDTAGAKRILEEIVQKAPDFQPAYMELATFAINDKKYDEADKYVDKVLSRDPDNYEALTLSGHIGLLQGNLTKGAAQFEKLTKVYTNAPQAFYELALAYNTAGDSGAAMATLNQALTINTNYFEAELALAQIKLAKGDASSAIVILKQLVQRHPQSPQPQLVLADAYRQQGDWESSSAVYKRLEEAFPQNAQIPSLRGGVLLQAGRREEARKEFEHALQIAPGYLSALEQLTDLEVSEGQAAKALAQMQSFVQLNTNAPEPTLLLAKIYYAQKNAKQAAALLQQIINTHPDFAPAYIVLANIYAESGQPQKTLEIARQLLAKHPDDPGALMQQATVLDGLKDVNGAEEAYEKVLKGSPKNTAALNNLAYLYGEHGQVDKGLELARRAKETMPGDPATADTLGWLLYRKGDYPQAALMLQDSVSKAPTVPDIQYHLGMARYMLGDEDAARASLHAATRAAQAFPGKDDAILSLSIMAIDPKTAGPEVRASLEKRVTEKPGDPIALSRLAMIYKRDGVTEKAVSTYEAAIKANPKNVRALEDLAQLYSTNQTTKAYALAKDAYKLTPEDTGLSRMLGHLAYESGDYKWSLSLLQDTARKRQPDPELLYDLALSSYSMGQVADAVTDARNALQAGAGFSRAAEAKRFLDMVALADAPAQAVAAASQAEQTLKANPTDVPALMVSGVIAEQKPDPSAAKDIFEKVLSRYPDFVPAKRHLAILYSQTPINDKRGLEIAFKAYEAYPDDADVIEALGVINYRLGDYTKAARFLKQNDAKKNQDAEHEFYLGMAEYQLKEKAAARKTLAHALELKLPDQQAADVKKALGELK